MKNALITIILMIIINMNRIVSDATENILITDKEEINKESLINTNKASVFIPPPMRRMNATFNLNRVENTRNLVTKTIYKKGFTS